MDELYDEFDVELEEIDEQFSAPASYWLRLDPDTNSKFSSRREAQVFVRSIYPMAVFVDIHDAVYDSISIYASNAARQSGSKSIGRIMREA